MKTCTKCRVTRPLEQFQKWKATEDGLHPHCKPCKKIAYAKYREANPEKVLATNIARREQNRLQARAYRKKYPWKAFEGYKKHGSTLRGHLAILVVSVRRRGGRVTKEQLMSLWQGQSGLCALTGEPMTHIKGIGRVPTNGSVDQIVPSGGYLDGNMRMVCLKANEMKGDSPDADFIEWCRKVLRNAAPQALPLVA
jgi:hypothetical protein